MIVRNELARYLEVCVAHLLEFCDSVRIYDDMSTDGWQEALHGAWGDAGRRVTCLNGSTHDRNSEPAFYRHADARNRLLKFTLDDWPTHILAIDADEFVGDGQAVRRACESRGDLWSLTVQEVWEASDRALFTREDGGWRSHEIGILWRPQPFRRQPLAIRDNGHATGRVPARLDRVRSQPTGTELLHFGWTNQAERDERYARYAIGDGGKFHARTHIDSIMWPARRVKLTRRPWPDGIAGRKADLLARVNRKVAA